MKKHRISPGESRLLERLVVYGERAPEPTPELAPHGVIRIIRNALHMTQAQLARRAALPQSHLAKIETGRVDVQISTFRRILRAMYCEAVVLPRFLKTPRTVLAERKRAAAGMGLAGRSASYIWDEPQASARIIAKEDERDDLRFWLARTPEDRIDAVERLRRQVYMVQGKRTTPRIARVARIMDSRP